MGLKAASTSVEVIATDEFVEWWDGLGTREHDAVRDAVELLERFGIGLPFPHSSKVAGSTLALRELRRKSAKHQLRVLYIFDPMRQAVLLVGGDKLGANQRLFYKALIAKAEALWAEYVKEQEGKAP